MIIIILRKKKFYPSYIVLSIIYSFFIIFGFLANSPREIIHGLHKIVTSPDILITDYIALAGIGATFVNAGLTSSACLLLLIFNGIKPNGSTIMALWLITGFSLFGKNIVNIWPIMIGVWLFSKYEKEPFLNYTLVTLLSTSLAPSVSQFTFGTSLDTHIGILLGIIIGIVTGFILAPVASHCIKAHGGYNLYNIGFSAGLIGTLIMAISRGFGVEFEERLLWYSGNNRLLFIFVSVICLFLIFVGFLMGDRPLRDLRHIRRQSGRLISDFYLRYGPSTYINMGLLGLGATLLVIVIGGDLNGPTLCGIFTIIGFGCFGKHPKNVTPVLLGAVFAAYTNINPMTSPSLILAILFSTCLCPIAGKFGFIPGMIAGFLHVNMATNIGYLHGGLNLYNNGLAGGLVAMIFIPILTTLKKEETI